MRSAFSRQLKSSAEPSAGVAIKIAQDCSGLRVSADDGNWWMITLSDLTLLLLGFLVAWYAIDKRTHATPQPPAVVEKVANKPLGTAILPAQSFPSEDWKEFGNEMQTFLIEAGLSKDVSIESSQTDLVIALRDTVPFASGRAELRNQALPILQKVASLALSHPVLFLEISGHTDSVPIATGIFPSNWELSAARASRVARYLIEKGIHPSRISVRGYANQRPKQPDSSPATRRANRRVELRLYYGAANVSPPASGAPTP